MDSSGKEMFGKLTDEIVNTPELREQYERTFKTVVLIRQTLMAIDAERERAGISKAELARRMGVAPSVVRRVFSSGSSNPTLQTILQMLVALDLELTVQPARRVRAAAPGSRRAKKGAAA